VPRASAVTEDLHPHSACYFYTTRNNAGADWYAISRAALQPGDALVRCNTSTWRGHIAIFAGSTARGYQVYECAGCRTGCRYRTKSFGSDYVAIRRRNIRKPECNEHGHKEDGVCVCDEGYAGDECDECAEGYRNYPECEEMEQICDDEVDNDGDGQTDCDDVEDCDCDGGPWGPCEAVSIRCGETVEDTTVGGSDLIDVHTGCSNWDDRGPERVYVLRNAPAGKVHADITAMQEGVDLDLFVHEDGCDPADCKHVGSHDVEFEYDPEKTTYLIVDGYKGAAGTFTLTVDCGREKVCDDEIDNDGDGLTDCDDTEDCNCDDPCQAVPVHCGDVIEDTTVGGTNKIDVHTNCSQWDDTGPERIYVLDPGDAEVGTLHANIVEMQQGMDLDIFVHEDGCEPETCKEMGSHEAWCGVDPGKKYYIIVDGYEGDEGTFTLEINCP
jgi:hypothetical protein